MVFKLQQNFHAKLSRLWFLFRYVTLILRAEKLWNDIIEDMEIANHFKYGEG